MSAHVDAPVPPQHTDFERSILGACMIEPAAIPRISGRLQAEHFYVVTHSLIWEAILTLHRNRQAVDFMTVSNALDEAGLLEQCGSTEYIIELYNVVPTAAGVDHYVDKVLDRWHRRELIRSGQWLVQRAFDMTEEPPAIGASVASHLMTLGTNAQAGRVRKMSQVLDDIYGKLEKWEDGNAGVCSTGLRDLDAGLGMLQSDDLVIIGGRPSMGKTALAGGWAKHVAEKFGPVLFATLEMRDVDIGTRILAAAAQVPAEIFRVGPRKSIDAAFEPISKGVSRLYNLPLYWWNGKASIAELYAEGQRIALREGRPLAAVFCDRFQYLKGIKSYQGSIYGSATELWHELHDAASAMHTPWIVLTQLSREVEKRADKRPILADLRDSGAAEEDAQVVLFVYRDEYYFPASPKKGTAEIIIAKNQNGITGYVDVAYIQDYVEFRDLAHPQHQDHWSDGRAS